MKHIHHTLLFRHLQLFLKNKIFDIREVAIAPFEEFLRAWTTKFYKSGTCQSESRWEEIVKTNGSYFDRIKIILWKIYCYIYYYISLSLSTNKNDNFIWYDLLSYLVASLLRTIQRVLESRLNSWSTSRHNWPTRRCNDEKKERSERCSRRFLLIVLYLPVGAVAVAFVACFDFLYGLERGRPIRTRTRILGSVPR